jgi:hypothetical protein
MAVVVMLDGTLKETGKRMYTKCPALAVTACCTFMLTENAAMLPDVGGVAVTLLTTISALVMGSALPRNELRTIHTDTARRINFRIDANTLYLHTVSTSRSALYAGSIRRTSHDTTTSGAPL